jgi:hypothetical protein
VSEQKHRLYPQPQGKKGDDLRGDRVEGDAEESAQTEAGGNTEGDQEDTRDAQGGLGAGHVVPTGKGEKRVQQLEKE